MWVLYIEFAYLCEKNNDESLCEMIKKQNGEKEKPR